MKSGEEKFRKVSVAPCLMRGPPLGAAALKEYKHTPARAATTFPAARVAKIGYCPNLFRYSSDERKALTIAARTKSPPNWLSFESQKAWPA